MIYTTRDGETFDLETNFSSPERHILQKLLIWQEMAESVAEFRLKKEEALLAGWNNSAPLKASQALQRHTADLEEKVARRLKG